MTIGSCFSGIGGELVAASMMGWDIKFHCEINQFGRAVLDYWFPQSKSYDDITKTDFKGWRGRVNVLTGGFPCQPFSYAGQRRGADDDRYLWPHMHRCIEEVQPDWVVCENVAGITTMVEQGAVSEVAGEKSLFDEDGDVHRYEHKGTFTIERICRDIEGHGYEVQPIVIPACAVGAPHQRERVFIVAHTTRRGEGTPGARGGTEGGGSGQNQQPSERRKASERDNRLHAVLRPSADTLCGDVEGGRRVEGLLGEAHPSGPSGGHRYAHLQDVEGLTPSERWRVFPVESPICGRDDGFPFSLDDLAISFCKWKTESLKAYGNSIVVQVMYEIFRAIQITEEQWR